MMFCKNCGTEINNGEKFCPKCGTNQSPVQNQNPVAPTRASKPNGYIEISKPNHYGAYLAWSIVSMVLGMWITGVIAAILNERSVAYFAVGNQLKCNKLQNGSKICLIISLVLLILKVFAIIAFFAFMFTFAGEFEDFFNSIISQF